MFQLLQGFGHDVSSGKAVHPVSRSSSSWPRGRPISAHCDRRVCASHCANWSECSWSMDCLHGTSSTWGEEKTVNLIKFLSSSYLIKERLIVSQERRRLFRWWCAFTFTMILVSAFIFIVLTVQWRGEDISITIAYFIMFPGHLLFRFVTLYFALKFTRVELYNLFVWMFWLLCSWNTNTTIGLTPSGTTFVSVYRLRVYLGLN